MIVILAASEPPRLTDLDRLDRLHAELRGELDEVQFEPLCERNDDEHVWLDAAGARSAGAAACDDPTFTERFDSMIAYATRKGWMNPSGTHVRAHIETAN